MGKVTEKVIVKNSLGLHIRPATEIVKILQNAKSEVQFSHKRQSVNAKSIISLLMLAVKKNGQIKISIEGEDAKKTMNKLIKGFQNKFGETD